jgi:hypothetical protein
MSSQSTTPSPRNTAVYFEASASPASAPKASHQRPSPVACSRASAQREADQNRISGRSGVITMPPTPTNIVALNSAAAQPPGCLSG